MILTNEQLARIEKRAAGVVAQGGVWVDGIRAVDVVALVSAYRTALWVRREIDRALIDHDMVGIANAAHQLPTDGRPLWEKD